MPNRSFGLATAQKLLSADHSVEPLLDHDYLAHTSYINNWDLVDVQSGVFRVIDLNAKGRNILA
jgi:hypothetical protein